MRRIVTALLTIITSIAFTISIGCLFTAIPSPEVDSVAIQQNYNLLIQDFHPEPQEHLRFITSAISFPILVVAFLWVYTRFASTLSKREIKLFYFLICFVAGGLFVWLLIADFSHTDYQYLDTSILQTKPLLVIIFWIVMLLGMLWSQKISPKYNKWISIIFYFIPSAILIFVLARVVIFSDADSYVTYPHFIAYFDPVVQTFLGKSLLVNNIAQYGLYPIFLKPIFQIIGLNVYKFTVIMAFIKSLAFLSILLLLWFNIENKWIAFVGFITLAFYQQLGIMNYKEIPDVYFQYEPHRTFFPQIFLALVWLYVIQKSKIQKKIIYYFIGLFSALAIFWNPDTGLIVFITWILTLFYVELLIFRTRPIKETFIASISHLVVNFSFIALITIGFYLYTFINSGSFPNIGMLSMYSDLFYVQGFYMLLIPNIIHPWNVIVLAYMLGLYIAIRYFLINNRLICSPISEKDQKTPILFFTLSIVGVGLFNYYVGRSADTSLIGPSWPALIISIFITDRLFLQLSRSLHGTSSWIKKVKRLFISRRIFSTLLFSGMFAFFSYSIINSAIYFPLSEKLSRERQAEIGANRPSFLQAQIRFIKENKRPESQVLILSQSAPELYLYTNTPRALSIPSFVELVLKSDSEKIIQFIENPPENAQIYLDTEFEIPGYPNTWLNLMAHMKETSSIQRGHFILFESKNP